MSILKIRQVVFLPGIVDTSEIITADSVPPFILYTAKKIMAMNESFRPSIISTVSKRLQSTILSLIKCHLVSNLARLDWNS